MSIFMENYPFVLLGKQPIQMWICESKRWERVLEFFLKIVSCRRVASPPGLRYLICKGMRTPGSARGVNPSPAKHHAEVGGLAAMEGAKGCCTQPKPKGWLLPGGTGESPGRGKPHQDQPRAQGVLCQDRTQPSWRSRPLRTISAAREK